ncbi:hypothetical protein DFH08DRAFT_914298 [Mycena albidolilacea]|uniref:Integrase core domain-containing protein n=1 Tax=Mycena albidolilacea TaxID=1033008 RepID=A0AAD7A3L4_9AGAR|nr:hypothetical protein DFH08DRAFT_914298 [Mycena albidolilacea]
MRKDDKAILRALEDHHIDSSKYGLGLTKFREIRESLGLFRTRKQEHSLDTIKPAMIRLRAQYPKAGARDMVGLLFHEEKMGVSRALVVKYFALYEPELVRERRKNRLRRKHFWAAGVNDIWAVDQHNKWKYKFGLALHSCTDPFVGVMHWMKIWWTNSNPRLILSYHLDRVEEIGGKQCSDPGTENYGLANGHTLLRHLHDPSLEGTLQHRWMVKKKNVMPEIGWSQLRHRFTPGFEDILDVGVNNGWYNPDILLEALVFRYVFIPWLQQELDAYHDRINNTAKRADRNKILPHGVPNDIYEHPSDYGVLDFKIKVRQNAIDTVRNLYAPKDHEVFQLVPPDFAAIVSQMYVEIGQPPVTRQSCWDIYLQLLNCFHTLDNIYNIPTDVDAKWGYALTLACDDYAKEIELLPNLRPLRNGDSVISPGGFCYMGGVNNGDGLDAQQCAHLDEMLNNNEPQIENDDDPQIFACFSDEEFTGPDEVDEW